MTAHRRPRRRVPGLPLTVATGVLGLVITTGTCTAKNSPGRPPAAESARRARAVIPGPAGDPIAAVLGENR